jgi:hypothetical protein
MGRVERFAPAYDGALPEHRAHKHAADARAATAAGDHAAAFFAWIRAVNAYDDAIDYARRHAHSLHRVGAL